MKLIESPVKITRSEEFEEAFFGIESQDDLKQIFNILRSKIYSNKILAVIREYSTNAADAHTLAGTPDLPIEVTYPSNFNPQFSIRDYGPGLSVEEVKSVYVKYGRSTKRDSNDFNGQLGLGCKAGFAYGDSFLVSTFQNGMRYDFECYIDETKIGKVALLQQVPSNEKNGVLVTIPVKPSDINNFIQTANNFYSSFNPTPKGSPRPSVPQKSIDLGDIQLCKSSTGINQGHALVAVMGNVMYPIDIPILRTSTPPQHWNSHFDQLNGLRNHGLYLVLNFKIGDLNIASSREALEYDKPTVKKIVDSFDKNLPRVKTYLEDTVKPFDDIFEAKKQLYTIRQNYTNQIYKVLWHHDLSVKLTDGTVVTSSEFDFMNYPQSEPDMSAPLPPPVKNPSGSTYQPPRPNKSYRNYKAACYVFTKGRDLVKQSLREQTRWNPGQTIELCILDTEDKIKRRAFALFESNPKLDMIIAFQEDYYPEGKKSFDDYIKSIGLKRSHFKLMSTVTPASRAVVKSISNPKHFEKTFKYNGGTYGKGSSNWDTVQVDPATISGYYVIINHFKPTELDSYYNMRTVIEQYAKATQTSLQVTDIYGIKVTETNTNPNLKNLFTEVKEYIAKQLKNTAITDELMLDFIHKNRGNLSGKVDLKKFITHFTRCPTDTIPLDPTTEVYKLMSIAQKLANRSIDKKNEAFINLLFNNLFIENYNEFEKVQQKMIDDIIDGMWKRYPLLKYFSIFSGAHLSSSQVSDQITDLFNYINTIDNFVPPIVKGDIEDERTTSTHNEA